MTSLQQLKADVVSGILCKCLDGISDCYVELRVKGVLNITVDFVKQYNLEVDTVCRKDLGVGAGNASNTAAAEDHIGSNSFSSLTSPAVHGQMRTIIDLGVKDTQAESSQKKSETQKQIETPATTPRRGRKKSLPATKPRRIRKLKSITTASAASSKSTRSSNPEETTQKGKKTPRRSAAGQIPSGAYNEMEYDNEDDDDTIDIDLDVDVKREGSEDKERKTPYHRQLQRSLQIVTDQKVADIKKTACHRRARGKMRQYSFEAVCEAVRMVKEENMPIATAAKLNGIPWQTLSNKVKGKTDLIIDPYKRRIFTREIEQEIAAQLKELGERTNGLTSAKIRDYLRAAQEKLPTNDNKKYPFSEFYIKKFLKRWPELQKYFITPQAIQGAKRKMANDVLRQNGVVIPPTWRRSENGIEVPRMEIIIQPEDCQDMAEEQSSIDTANSDEEFVQIGQFIDKVKENHTGHSSHEGNVQEVMISTTTSGSNNKNCTATSIPPVAIEYNGERHELNNLQQSLNMDLADVSSHTTTQEEQQVHRAAQLLASQSNTLTQHSHGELIVKCKEEPSEEDTDDFSESF